MFFPEGQIRHTSCDSRDIEAMLESFEVTLEIGAASALRPFVDQAMFNMDELDSRAARLQFILSSSS